MWTIRRAVGMCGMAFIAATLSSSSAWALDLLVPSQYPTIQAAIDAAGPTDTVVVATGVYMEALVVSGKRVHILGLDGAPTTIVDASALNTSVIALDSSGSESLPTRIEGLTLRHGTGVSASGGGVRASGSAFTMIGCTLTENSATITGGGAALHAGCNATFTNCNFFNNTARFGGGVGQAIVNPGSATFFSCTFYGNVAMNQGTNNPGRGGGAWTRNAVFSDCTFELNSALPARTGITLNGGGIDAMGTLAVSGTSFNQNVGSAVLLTNTSIVSTLTSCDFVANTAHWGGGGLFLQYADAMLADCEFSANTALEGGAVNVNTQSSFEATGCVFSFNSASNAAGAIGLGAAVSATLNDCDLHGNAAGPGGAGGGIAAGLSGTLTLHAVDIYENTAAVGGGLYTVETAVEAGDSSICLNMPDNVNTGAAVIDLGGNNFCGEIFGDLNGDGAVDGADLGLLLSEWGTTGPTSGDLNNDYIVDGADLGLLLGAWSA